SFYQRMRDREVTAAKLEAQLSQAELRALKMQLHPHFLFNTLNSISSLMSIDVKAADLMISRLGDLLRVTLEKSGMQEIALAEEIQFIETYLELETTRFRDRLKVTMNIEDETLDAQVPSLIL